MNPETSFVSVKNAMDSVPPGSDDEDSFVVLESSPSHVEESMDGEVLPLFRTNKVREMQSLIRSEISQLDQSVPHLPSTEDPLDAVASSVAKITISPDSSYEEIQKQVEELIKDNETLKNVIVQNNVNMKDHFKRFEQYRIGVDVAMKSYREKFNQAKMFIERCKEENAKLASDVEVYINIKKLQEEEIINLKEKLHVGTVLEVVSGFDDTRFKEMQTELAQANLKITELQYNYDKQEKLVFQEKETYIRALEENKRILENYNQTVRDLNKENAKLKEEINQVYEKLKNSAKSEELLQTKQQEINVFEFDISNLKTEVAKLKTQNEEIRKLKTQNEELKVRLNDNSKESEKIAELNKIITSIEQKLKIKSEDCDFMRHKIDEDNCVCNAQLDEINSLRFKTTEVQEKYTALNERFHQTEAQLTLSQKTVPALEAELDKKNQEIETLRKMIQQNENDEIFALQEQLTLYKNDFEAEKESKVALKREKDQIAEDLQKIQSRNKQLQNEVETLRARNTPKAEGYSCPKCSFAFTSYQSLENHVHRCLDLDGFP